MEKSALTLDDFDIQGKYMKGVLVKFDLPFLLLLEDGFRDIHLEEWYEYYKAGKKDRMPYKYAPIRTDQSYMPQYGDVVHIPDPNVQDNAYWVYLPEIDTQIELRFLKRVNTQNRVIMNAELLGDIAGHVSFSSVDVYFYLQPPIIDNLTNVLYYYHGLAINAINRLIENYRVIFRRPYIKKLSSASLYASEIIVTYVDDTIHEIGTIYSNATFHTEEDIYVSPEENFSTGLIPFSKLPLKDPDKRLREVLLAGLMPPTLTVLSAEVLHRLHNIDARGIIIEAAVFLEAWINAFIRDIYKQRYPDLNDEAMNDKFIAGNREKLSDSERKKIERHILDTYGKTIKITNNKHSMSVFEIVHELSADAFGFEFKKTDEWKNLLENIIEKRNKIVHGYLDNQYIHLSQEEEEEQVESVINCLGPVIMMIYREAKSVDPELLRQYCDFNISSFRLRI